MCEVNGCKAMANLKEEEFDVVTGDRVDARETDSERFTQKYTAGANWYPFHG